MSQGSVKFKAIFHATNFKNQSMVKKSLRCVDSKATIPNEPIYNGMYDNLENEMDTLVEQQLNDSITIIDDKDYKLKEKVLAPKPFTDINDLCRKENKECADIEDIQGENILRIKSELFQSEHIQNETGYREADKIELETDVNIDVTSTSHKIPLKVIAETMNVTPLLVHRNDKQMALAVKYLDKWKNYVAKNHYAIKRRENKLNSFLEKLTKKKINSNSSQLSDQENKAQLLAKDGMYQHRYKMQKHIIALQRAKLEEQNRLIEELKYNKIIEASKQSVDSMRDEIRKTYYDVDRNLKPKLKFMANELNMEIEEPSLVLHCLKVPQFLQRMEKRAREREEKHAVIRERRKQMEEERQRLKQQAEVAKAEMDKDEQIKIIKDLREKRKREKIENIRKKQHAERMRALCVMADLHYERYLKIKYGLRPLNILLDIRRNDIEKAGSHYKFQLMKNVFLNWMWHAEDAWFERNFKAKDCYRKKCLKRVFECFKKNTQELALKKQVAEDYYDLYVVRLAFRKFREGIAAIKKEHDEKWQKALRFYQSELLFKTLTCWRALPALNAIQREQEARKERWRQKVLQVVPDYTPPDD